MGVDPTRLGESDVKGLVRFIQRTTREWMDVTRRLSPRMLVDMIRGTALDRASGEII